MSKRNDGGPAFPVALQEGMTLRDYFAAKVMRDIAWQQDGQDYERAKACYKIADAMLAAREAEQ